MLGLMQRNTVLITCDGTESSKWLCKMMLSTTYLIISKLFAVVLLG